MNLRITGRLVDFVRLSYFYMHYLRSWVDILIGVGSAMGTVTEVELEAGGAVAVVDEPTSLLHHELTGTSSVLLLHAPVVAVDVDVDVEVDVDAVPVVVPVAEP